MEQTQWKELREIDVQTVDPESLVDIRDVIVDETLSAEERKKEYLRRIKNPYCFRYGSYVIKLVYEETGVSLEERWVELMEKLVRLELAGNMGEEEG